jgi:glutamate-1-semialdehyde 2,1-aminomutase
MGSQNARVAHSGITRKFRRSGQEIQFERGEGGYVFDGDGNAYLDLVMGYGPVILGHAHPGFQERVGALLGNGLLMPGYTSLHDEYLSRLLREHDNRHGAFFKTASEAVTAAFRTAAMETGKLGILRSGYVGWHDAQIAHSIKWHDPLHSPLRGKLRYTEHMRGVGPDEPVLNWVDLSLGSLGELVDRNRSKLGCFVFDAYLASFTDVDTIASAIEICHDADMVVVFDETKTGGRISKLGYAHDHGLDVDLIVIGKSLANGAPLSILIGKESLMTYAEKARLSGTFSKELFAVYAASATLEIMERGRDGFDTGWNEVAAIGRRFAETVRSAAARAGVDDDLGARPVLGGGMFELSYSERILPRRTLRKALLRDLANHGILLLEGHPSFVCLDHAAIDWEGFEDSFHRALTEWSRREELDAE